MNIVTTKVFSYGSLQYPEVQLEVFKRHPKKKIDKLCGYRLGQLIIDGICYLNIVSENTKSIIGNILELTETELLLADNYEGENYTRIIVTLESGTKAWVYIKNDLI